MNRKLALLLLACAAVGLIAPMDSAAAERPNVIVVITDDQGYGDLACHGNPVLKTPHLDRLSRESVRFTDFHVSPMCTPTRGQLLSGLDCLRNGAMNVSSGRTLLRREFPTMANLFAAAGYRCGQFGKWHLGDNYPYRPHDRGFHEAVYYPSSHISSAPDFWNNDYFDDTYLRNGVRESFPGYTTDVFFREAIAWMQAQAEGQQPFFCYLATAAAHGPLFVPEKYRQPYRDQKPNVASFFGMIANIDENIGLLEEFLKASGLRENTILIFLTDNGGTAGVPVFNAGMRGRKIELYDGGHRVSCFWRWPGGGFAAPREIGELSQVQDVLPTLIDLCELETPNGVRFDGMSLAPLLLGMAERLPDRMFVVQFSRMNAPRPQKGDACVLWRRWRLIGDRELFELETDPAQMRNVAAERPEIVSQMRAHYATWWSGLDPLLDNFEPIVLGAEPENPALLSPCEWADVFLDQSAQVRRGERKNGVWHVEVSQEGKYEFALRRWPTESGAAITAALPEYQAADGRFPAGVALPIARARLRIQDCDESAPVASEDKAVVFTTRLKPGRATLQTWFDDLGGNAICGAYYVYVTRK